MATAVVLQRLAKEGVGRSQENITIMWCVDPSEPRLVRRVRALSLLQLICEILALFLSMASTADGGAVCLVAGACGLGAAVAGLAKNLRYRQAFSLVSMLNFVGGFLGFAQCTVLVQRYITIEVWCCTLATTNKDTLRGFLLVLCLLFLGDSLLRLVIAGVAMPARYAPDVGIAIWPHGGGARIVGSGSRAMTMQQQEMTAPHGGGAPSAPVVVAMGVPIAEPTAVVAAAATPRGGSGAGPEVECIDGQVPEVISAVAAQHRTRGGEAADTHE